MKTERVSLIDDTELCNDHKANRDVEISSRDEVATSENVLKEYLTLEDVLLRKSPPQVQKKKSLVTTALETEEPEKTEDKLSFVSTTTSQEPNRTFNNPERSENVLISVTWTNVAYRKLNFH